MSSRCWLLTCRPWLQLLWRWLGAQPAGSVAHLLGLPVLPVAGGRLAPLADRATCTALMPPTTTTTTSTTTTGTTTTGTPVPAAVAVPAAPVGSAAGSAPAVADTSTSRPLTRGSVVGDPTARLCEVLTQLGLHLVDANTHTFGEVLPVGELLRGGHVHAPDGPGILAALLRLSAATMRPSDHRNAQQQQGMEGEAGGVKDRPVLSATLSMRVSALAAEEKRLLRGQLLTVDCLGVLAGAAQGQQVQGQQGAKGRAGGLTQQEGRMLMQLLAALPIYESARGATSRYLAAAAGAAGSAGGGSGGVEGEFVALSGAGTCFLAPAGVEVAVLGAVCRGYVVAASEAEGRLMAAHLGVRAVSAAEAYRWVLGKKVMHEQLRSLLEVCVRAFNAASGRETWQYGEPGPESTLHVCLS